MSAKFYTLLTEIGAAKLASAAALGVPLKITQMAVGDGGGVLPSPSAQQTALIAEKRRANLNMLYIDPQNSSQIIAEQVIPETEGGWWIREVGLFDDTGALIAVGNCPESYKPQLAEGSGRTQTVRMVLITSSTDNITLKIDPSVVLATRKYVDDKVLELRVHVDDLMAKHLAAPDPHSQYAPKASPAFTGAPTAPTPVKSDNSKKLATTEFVAVALAALAGSAPETLDTLKELADALGNDPNFATTVLNKLAEKLAKDQNGADIPDKGLFIRNIGLGTAAKADAGDFISSGGGNYPAYLRMTGVETLPTSKDAANLSALYSAPAPIPANVIVAGGVANWYRYQAMWGLFRDGSDGILGWGVQINGVTKFMIAPDGGCYAANQKLATEIQLSDALAGKQDKNQTLTDLSGKNHAQLRDYLQLGSAATKTVGNGPGQVPDMSFFPLSGGVSGYMKLPNGFIFQWGQGNAGAGSANIPFPLMFPGGCVGVEITGTSARASNDMAGVNVIAGEINAGGFGVNGYLIRPGGQVVPQGVAFIWTAWGY
jgi:hypothetical protein